MTTEKSKGLREWELTRTNLRGTKTPIVMAINGSDNFKINERIFVREVSPAQDAAVLKLVEALKHSQETLEAILFCDEKWTLEQERLGNKGVGIPAINYIKKALADYAKLEEYHSEAAE